MACLKVNKINHYAAFGSVRVVEKEDGPWFAAADVCRILEIVNTSDALSSLDEDERAALAITEVSSNGIEQSRSMNIITEPGLYSLILRSRKPEAKAFKRWITHDVIPAIRKTGMYGMPSDLIFSMQ